MKAKKGDYVLITDAQDRDIWKHLNGHIGRLEGKADRDIWKHLNGHIGRLEGKAEGQGNYYYVQFFEPLADHGGTIFKNPSFIFREVEFKRISKKRAEKELFLVCL